MNNITNVDFNDINTMNNCYFQFREGDPIIVITASGATFTGVFIRIQGNFLLWVRIVNNVPRITLTSLDSITITKL